LSPIGVHSKHVRRATKEKALGSRTTPLHVRARIVIDMTSGLRNRTKFSLLKKRKKYETERKVFRETHPYLFNKLVCTAVAIVYE
jgi:hypothetical protein